MKNKNKQAKNNPTEQARESLRLWLVKYTGCAIQEGANGKLYPCGTCVIDLLKRLGVKEDKQHNKPIDRLNEMWRGILQIRGDKQ